MYITCSDCDHIAVGIVVYLSLDLLNCCVSTIYTWLYLGYCFCCVPPPHTHMHKRSHTQSPEIRKYKRKFNGEILCGALWGVNLLVGTDNGLLLLDRSGHGKGGLYLENWHLPYATYMLIFWKCGCNFRENICLSIQH